MKEQIKEIQKEFQDSLDTWADIILGFEVKTEEVGIVPDKYKDDALMNATVLFRHTLFNIAYHNNLIDEDKATALGNELYEIIKKYTGIDSRTFYDSKDDNKFFNLN